MYKMMIFLNKSDDEYAYDNFKDVFIKSLEEITGEKILIAKIEGAALAGEKYSHYCEIIRRDKDEMDALFASQEGKNFAKTVQNFLGSVTLFYANFNTITG